MQIAQKIISSRIDRDANGDPLNPIDAHFKSLQLESMVPVDNDCPEFAALSAYAVDTHGATHSSYRVNVQSAFRVKRSVWATTNSDAL